MNMKKGTVKNFEQKKLRRKFKKLTTTTTIPDDVTVINDKRIISLNSNGLQKKKTKIIFPKRERERGERGGGKWLKTITAVRITEFFFLSTVP